MPLNLSSPRSAPTLGRRRAVHELKTEARDKYPESDILIGLRSQGGPWVQRDPEEQRRIDRYRAAIKDPDYAHPAHVSPQGWKYPVREEIINVTDAVLAKKDRVIGRSVKPQQIYVHHRSERNAVEVRLEADLDSGETLYAVQQITNEEMLRYNVDAIEVVDVCLTSAYRQMIAEYQKYQSTKNIGSIKPVTH